MKTLKAEILSLSSPSGSVVKDLTVEIPVGGITTIIGPNGAGKSTLLRGLAGVQQPDAGTVTIGGTALPDHPIDDIARILSLLPENPGNNEATTVRERVADVLARESQLLLLDEPTTHLDVAQQLEVLDAIAELNRRRGTTVVMVLHDLNLAARYADHLLALVQGNIVAAGRPSDVLTAELVHEVSGLRARVVPDPVAGTPLVLPIGRHRFLRPGTGQVDEPRVQAPRLDDEVAAPGSATGQSPAAQPVATSPVDGAPEESAVVPAPRRPAVEVCPTLAFSLDIVDTQKLGLGFRRLTLAGQELKHFGTGGHPLDLRIKVLVPPVGEGAVAQMRRLFADLAPDGLISEEASTGWYRSWLAKDPAERGSMRTYTVRSFRSAGHPGNAGSTPEMDLDFVLHVHRENGVLVGGPASVWAAGASIGDEIIILGPNRALCGPDYGGIEFRPGKARRILLAGDETAAPAICSILESLPPGITGDAFIEVPSVEDIQGSFTRSGVAVQWLPRGMQDPGTLLEAAVRSAVALPGAGAVDPGNDLEDVDVDEDILWETAAGTGQPFYAWLAGEAGVIKSMRRYLVREVGIDRKQVSFMGYWRAGRAET